MTTALGCIYGLGYLFFTIAFLVDWIKSRKAIRKYLKYGIWAGLIVIGLDLLIVAITPSSWQPTVFILLIAEPIVFLRQVGFTMLGMYYLAGLGYSSFPVILKKFSVASDESDNNANVVVEDNPHAETIDMIQPVNSMLQDMSEQVYVPNENRPKTDLLLDIKWRDYFLTVFGVSVIGILYSVVLFLLTTPKLSEIAQKTFGSPSAGFENAITIQGILLVLEFAVAEEIVFRLGIQSFLVKYLKLEGKGYWIAILLSSTLWTLGHAGTLNPEWVKLAQIFPMGLMLGWMFRKYGAESTILVHGLFNVVLAFLSVYLLR